MKKIICAIVMLSILFSMTFFVFNKVEANTVLSYGSCSINNLKDCERGDLLRLILTLLFFQTRATPPETTLQQPDIIEKPTDPIVCTTQYDPVCGINGITYSNYCEISKSGITIAHEGECSISKRSKNGIILVNKNSDNVSFAEKLARERGWKLLKASSSNPENIRKNIIDLATSDVEYLLILGDDSEIPITNFSVLAEFLINMGVANQLDFKDNIPQIAVNNTLDNLYYGNIDDDVFVELSVGRIPFSNSEDVENYFSNLTITKEIDHVSILRDKDAIAPLPLADVEKQFINFKTNYIKNISYKNEISEYLEKSDLFILHAHGAPDYFQIGNEAYTAFDVPDLHDNKPIFISGACYTAKKIGEDIVKKGAIAFIGYYVEAQANQNSFPIRPSQQDESIGQSIKNVINKNLAIKKFDQHTFFPTVYYLIGDPSIKIDYVENNNFSKALVSKESKNLIINIPKYSYEDRGEEIFLYFDGFLIKLPKKVYESIKNGRFFSPNIDGNDTFRLNNDVWVECDAVAAKEKPDQCKDIKNYINPNYGYAKYGIQIPFDYAIRYSGHLSHFIFELPQSHNIVKSYRQIGDSDFNLDSRSFVEIIKGNEEYYLIFNESLYETYSLIKDGNVYKDNKIIMAVSSLIPAPSINLLYPNGGETFRVGNQYDISWNSIGVDNVNIYLELNGGATESLIASNVPANLGYYSWKVNMVSAIDNQHKIRVSDAKNNNIFDKSNDYFRIITDLKPSIKITSPVAGSTLVAGESYVISWQSKNLTGNNIYIHGNGSELIATLPINATSYLWTVPESYGDVGAGVIWVGSDKNGRWEVTEKVEFKVEKKNESWALVFTYRDEPLPEEFINFACNELSTAVNSWIKRESSNYQKMKPFSDIICFQDQILISGDLLEGNLMSAEGHQFINPINSARVIDFLEDSFNFFVDSKYVTVFHYVSHDIQFANYTYSKKYDFNFIKTPNEFIPFYPELTIDSYGITLAHELMHKLGATDKYGYTIDQACLSEPVTGLPYSGYDIMCHRVPNNGEGKGFNRPPLSDLIVSRPTAEEIGWK